MSKIKTLLAALLLVPASTFAGGLLTNTNQSVSFLRNPARDGAIGIDGVYSNPAGVLFLGRGFHLGLNIQSAYQNRDVTTQWMGFQFGAKNYGQTRKEFKGQAKAPVIPSIDAAYNWNKVSVQFHFAVGGGGGKCDFDNGLGMFERIPSTVALAAASSFMSSTGSPMMYDLDMSMSGRQYYYGASLGVAYEVVKNLSVYAGARLVYGSCSYKGNVSNIRFAHPMLTSGAYVPLSTVAGTLDAMGMHNATLSAYAPLMDNGIVLDCSQSGIGVTPIIGVDYRLGKWNFAAKYEFNTRMELKNSSNLQLTDPTVQSVDQLKQYADGVKDRGDIPGTLTVGVQYEPIENLRLNVGYHWYNDTNAASTNDRTKKLDGDSHEILAGFEWDINKWLQFSAGWQRTMYGVNNDYLNDMSFITSSNSFGLGFGVNVAKWCKINLAYFCTLYDGYDTTIESVNQAIATSTPAYINNYTRTNRVFGIGAEFKF